VVGGGITSALKGGGFTVAVKLATFNLFEAKK
jgi:hypothetical protein